MSDQRNTIRELNALSEKEREMRQEIATLERFSLTHGGYPVIVASVKTTVEQIQEELEKLRHDRIVLTDEIDKELSCDGMYIEWDEENERYIALWDL